MRFLTTKESHEQQELKMFDWSDYDSMTPEEREAWIEAQLARSDYAAIQAIIDSVS